MLHKKYSGHEALYMRYNESKIITEQARAHSEQEGARGAAAEPFNFITRFGIAFNDNRLQYLLARLDPVDLLFCKQVCRFLKLSIESSPFLLEAKLFRVSMGPRPIMWQLVPERRQVSVFREPSAGNENIRQPVMFNKYMLKRSDRYYGPNNYARMSRSIFSIADRGDFLLVSRTDLQRFEKYNQLASMFLTRPPVTKAQLSFEVLSAEDAASGYSFQDAEKFEETITQHNGLTGQDIFDTWAKVKPEGQVEKVMVWIDLLDAIPLRYEEWRLFAREKDGVLGREFCLDGDAENNIGKVIMGADAKGNLYPRTQFN